MPSALSIITALLLLVASSWLYYYNLNRTERPSHVEETSLIGVDEHSPVLRPEGSLPTGCEMKLLGTSSDVSFAHYNCIEDNESGCTDFALQMFLALRNREAMIDSVSEGDFKREIKKAISDACDATPESLRKAARLKSFFESASRIYYSLNKDELIQGLPEGLLKSGCLAMQSEPEYRIIEKSVENSCLDDPLSLIQNLFPLFSRDSIVIKQTDSSVKKQSLDHIFWDASSTDLLVFLEEVSKKTYMPPILVVRYHQTQPEILRNVPSEISLVDLSGIPKQYQLVSRRVSSEPRSVEVRTQDAFLKIDPSGNFVISEPSPVISKSEGMLFYQREYCESWALVNSVNPWINVFKRVPQLSSDTSLEFKLLVLANSFRNPLIENSTNDELMLANDQVYFNSLNLLQKNLFKFTLPSDQVRTFYIFRLRSTDRNLMDVVFNIGSLSDILVISSYSIWPYKVKTLSEIKRLFDFEFTHINRRFKLRGTIQGDLLGQWAHVFDDTWMSTATQSELLPENVIDEFTQFLIYSFDREDSEGVIDTRLQLESLQRDFAKVLQKSKEYYLDLLAANVSSELVWLATTAIEDIEQMREYYIKKEVLKEFLGARVNKLSEMAEFFLKKDFIYENMKSILHRKKADSSLPLAFPNYDGSCFLQAMLNLIMHSDDFSRIIDSIPDENIEDLKECFLKSVDGSNAWYKDCNKNKFKTAMLKIQSQKEQKAPFALLTELRSTLGDKFLYGAQNVYDIVNSFRDHFTSLATESFDIDISAIPESTPIHEYLDNFMEEKELSEFGGMFARIDPKKREIPFTIHLTYDVMPFKLVATMQTTENHAFSHFRVPIGDDFEWFVSNNGVVERISPDYVVGPLTTLVYYKKERSFKMTMLPENIGKTYTVDKWHPKSGRLYAANSYRFCIEVLVGDTSEFHYYLQSGNNVSETAIENLPALSYEAMENMNIMAAKCRALSGE